MSHRALNPEQFPRSGYVHEPHVGVELSETGPGRYYLRNLAVAHEHRSKGLGTRFMKGLLAEHDVAGSTISLHVGTKRQRLQKWYEGMGFEPQGEDVIGTRMTRQPTR